MTSISHPVLKRQILIYDNTNIFDSRLIQLFRHFEIADEKINCDTSYRIYIQQKENEFEINNGKSSFFVKSEKEVLAAVSHLFYENMVISYDDFFCLHGSNLVYEDNNYLFIGKKSSGKSTLTLRLCDLGFEYASDDIIPINMNNFVSVSFPKLIYLKKLDHLKEYGWMPQSNSFENFSISYGEDDIKLYSPSKIININKCLNINKIFFVERKEEYKKAEINKINDTSAFYKIVSCCKNKNSISNNCKNAAKLLNKKGLYYLSYWDGRQAIEELKKTINY